MKRPDAQVKINGQVFDLFLTKDEHGHGAVAYHQDDQLHQYAISQQSDHDFRANALADLVATIYQRLIPGTANDDHAHDADEEFSDE